MVKTTRISVTDGRVGDIVWSAGIQVEVREREEFNDNPSGRLTVQLRGPVLNYYEMDSATRNYVGMMSRRHWWTIQGNELAKIEKEEVS